MAYRLGQWNLYLYARSNPVHLSDPYGLFESWGKSYVWPWQEGASWNPLNSIFVDPAQQVAGEGLSLITTGGFVPIGMADEVAGAFGTTLGPSVGKGIVSISISGAALGQDVGNALLPGKPLGDSSGTWDWAYEWGPHGQLYAQDAPDWVRNTAMGTNVGAIGAGIGALTAGFSSALSGTGTSFLFGGEISSALVAELFTSGAFTGTIVGGVAGFVDGYNAPDAETAAIQGLSGAALSGFATGTVTGTIQGATCPRPPNGPYPPGWNDQWEWGPPSGERPGQWRWWDAQGGEWRWHAPDQWHPQGHWDYNPWTDRNSPWQNVNP